MSGVTVPGHSQVFVLRTILYYPDHSPREVDPNYHFFNMAKNRMKKAGLLKCNVQGCQYDGTIELHHYKVEFALQNGIDLEKFNEEYGLHLDDKGFAQYIEEEGNLEPLCAMHHRGLVGVHNMPEPAWQAVRVWKKDLPPPSQVSKV